MTTLKSFDFASHFVTIDRQEEGAEFQVLSDAGEPSGFFITLAGPDAKCRKPFASKAQRLVLKVTGADGSIQEDKVEAVDHEYEAAKMDEMVAATLGWRFPEGFEGPEFKPETVRDLYRKHRTIYRQVLARANDLARFTKR